MTLFGLKECPARDAKKWLSKCYFLHREVICFFNSASQDSYGEERFLVKWLPVIFNRLLFKQGGCRRPPRLQNSVGAGDWALGALKSGSRNWCAPPFGPIGPAPGASELKSEAGLGGWECRSGLNETRFVFLVKAALAQTTAPATHWDLNCSNR